MIDMEIIAEKAVVMTEKALTIRDTAELYKKKSPLYSHRLIQEAERVERRRDKMLQEAM